MLGGNMKIKKINSRAEDIYFQMKTAILYGYPDFFPGDILNEARLAEFYKVSKTPVRETLNRLRHENLVEVIPYKGYLVTNLSYNDLIDLFQLRLILEPGAVEMAVRNITNHQLDRLKRMTYQDDIEKIEDSSLYFRKLNLEFHTLIAQSSGNKWLTDSVRQVLEQMQRALFHDVSKSELEPLHRKHWELVTAMQQRDSELATKLMKSEIEEAKIRILRYRNEI
jgi:DNA-binding GntR family transcriptional regulator